MPISDGSWRAKNARKHFQNTKTQNLQNEAISDDDDKTKYSENPQNISQSAKKGYEG